MDLFSYAYAALVTVGGVIGYVKAGSTVSLGMGLLFGSLSAFGAYKVSANPKDALFLLCVSGTLGAVMGYRSLNSGKFMPAGLVASLSAITFLRMGYNLYLS
ncbi:DgyrCDS981 [Dimorphilus gyrociliatus]|uniref:DgyrCDS981 n=1 Tax=Dimorphilus gyrociliatus TaxID=2664684 RepID=A0A7I8V688_9ANNE|nr:DgyrCDS981 [Dimorphilus gyrociliatus]